MRLTPKEFDLLRYLVAHAGKPVPHRELLQAVWGPDYGDQTDYLRVFITHLRKKIEPNPAKPQYILTDPWLGYRFETPNGRRLATKRHKKHKRDKETFESLLCFLCLFVANLLP